MLKILFITVLALTNNSQTLAAETQHYKGVIKSINETGTVAQITNGDLKNREVQTQNGNNANMTTTEYKPGDHILVLQATNPDGSPSYFITSFDRVPPLFWLFVLFCAVVVWVSKKWGMTSILGMVYSFLIIFKVLLPLLLDGKSPLGVAIFGALLISPVTFYLSHGFNRKTTVALVSTMVSLVVTGTLAVIFIDLTRLTGFGSDEAFFLQVNRSEINIKGLYLAGIIIGSLGILDDITVSQSAIVLQLKNSIRGIGHWELYKKAMEIGHDHIASAVNTLVLVYTGAALPLLLLFTNSAESFSQALNSEIVADEIVRTLVASIGLVLAVPISTWLAVFFSDSSYQGHNHRH